MVGRPLLVLGPKVDLVLIASAKDTGVHRLALMVVSKNKVMIAFYGKFGFEIEGEMRDTFFGQDENYHDMIIIGKTW